MAVTGRLHRPRVGAETPLPDAGRGTRAGQQSTAVRPETDTALGFPESTYLYDASRQLIYLPIPKVACTSLKTWFVKTSPSVDFEPDPATFKVNLWLGDEGSHCLLEDVRLLSDARVFRFCFVRNPWSRLVSAYLNRIVGQGIEYEQLMTRLGKGEWYRVDRRARFALRRRLFGVGWSERAELSFREFVAREIAVSPAEEMDPHWRPQCSFLGRYALDFVGRFERLDEDMAALGRKLGIDEALPERNRSRYVPTDGAGCHADSTPAELRGMPAMPRYRQFYTAELVDVVARVYAEDVERFGYDF